MAEAATTSNATLNTRIGPIELLCDHPTDASVKKLYDELDFERAVQAYIWAVPLVSSEALRIANKRDWGVDFNTVSIVDDHTTSVAKVLTGNNATIYAGIFVDLQRDGPVVIESPPGVYGVIDDFWQRPVVEIGPFGPDKGAGGKFLLLPPDYAVTPPPAYMPARALTNRVIYIGRAFVRDGDV